MRRVNEDPLMKMRKMEMEVSKNRLANSDKLMKSILLQWKSQLVVEWHILSLMMNMWLQPVSNF